MGWRYALTVDSHFLNKFDNQIYNPKNNYADVITNTKDDFQLEKPQLSETEIISNILKQSDLISRWSYVQRLVSNHWSATISDSFSHLNEAQYLASIIKYLSGNTLNVVILGAGCTGLLLANSLKISLGNKIKILLVENRVIQQGIKKPYNRRWITNIDLNSISETIDPVISRIFKEFGSNNFMGATLDVFESLLLLSCKQIGVKFYFNNSDDISFLKQTNTHMIFDATGGNLNLPYSRESEDKQVTVSYLSNNRSENLFYNPSKNKLEINTKFDLVLKNSGNKYYPFLKGHQVKAYMVKLTGIPISCLGAIEDYVRNNNSDNLFYIWQGKLNPKINEVLVIVNLLRETYEDISQIIDKKITLENFIQNIGPISGRIDSRIIELMRRISMTIALTNNPLDHPIFIEKPFSFIPYITFFDEKLPVYYDIPVFPIGDTIFCGHPKLGNGLGFHVWEIKRLSEKIVSTLLEAA